MMRTQILKRILCALVILSGVAWASAQAAANDLPTAAGSPIAGISFDDRPLMLPVQRNFQMAMLTASSELGRSCGRMEAYGWRLDASEQDRVNQLFNNTVDRMRAQGYAVEAKAPTSVAKDVTLFTADRTDRHLIFLWSAGEIGLVMVLCETSAPLSPIPQAVAHEAETQPATLPSQMPMAKTSNAVPRAQVGNPIQLSVAGRQLHAHFSPMGKWTGNYTCAQGTTGATLDIEKIRGEQFEGVFRFFPTPKNPYVPKGSYAVFGEYDSDSQRILINPGKWIERPKDYFNTIMIGSFDPVSRTFSGYFQGITGCTSFEAVHEGPAAKAVETPAPAPKAAVKKKHVAKKKAAAKKPAVSAKTDVNPVDPFAAAGAAPSQNQQAAPVKGNLSIIGEPAKVPSGSANAPRNSSFEPPVGIVLGTTTDKK